MNGQGLVGFVLERKLYFFVGDRVPDSESVDLLLRELLVKSPVPEAIHFVVPVPLLREVREVVADSGLESRIPEQTRYHNPPALVFLSVDCNGRISRGDRMLDRVSEKAIYGAGLSAAFRSGGGLLRGMRGFHYGKPGRNHADGFMRAGSAFQNSAAAFMAAYAVMSMTSIGNPRVILTDTSTINAVGIALAELLRERARAAGAGVLQPTVECFGGWEKLPEVGIEVSDDAILLLSATTSGALARELVENRGVSKRAIVQIFSTEVEDSRDAATTCYLTDHEQYGGEFAITSWGARECPRCREGDQLISVVSEQFLPAEPLVSKYMLKISDAPRGFAAASRNLVGRGILRAHLAAGGRVAKSIGVEVEESLVSESEVVAKFKDLASRRVPIGVETIFHLNDESSRRMALILAGVINAGRAPGAMVVVHSTASLFAGATPQVRRGVALIVGAVVDSGRAMLNVSMALRSIGEITSIVYITLITRSDSPLLRKALSSNLIMGPGGHAYLYESVVELPAPSQSLPSSWNREAEFCQEILEWDDGGRIPEVAQVWFKDRGSRLGAAPELGGLVDDLFIECSAGEGSYSRLRLNPNFAFWSNGLEGLVEGSSQADLFWAIAAIVGSVRNRPDGLADGHDRTVLAPHNFLRFNDPAIQAALLRSCRSNELRYDLQEDLSRDMASIIEGVLDGVGDVRGGAAAEFLLAMCTRHLLLSPDSEARLGAKLQARESGFPPVLRALSHYYRAVVVAR